MKVLITGGAGFVGSSIGIQLKQRYPAYQFTAFDNLVRKGSELNLADLKKHGIVFINGDIRNPGDLAAAGNFDVLIEASAEPSVLAGIHSDPLYVIDNNLVGSINCFNACLRQKARVIFLSTSRVYPVSRIDNARYTEQETRYTLTPEQTERGIARQGISETLSVDGSRSFYGTTKLSSELFINEYAAFYGLQAAVTRYGVIAGPRQMGRSDQGIVALWLARHFWKQPLAYIGYNGSGKQVRDVLHVDDVVDLTDLQLHYPEKFSGRVYNAGGGVSNSLSLLEMTALCERITGNKITITPQPEGRPADVRIYISDNGLIEKDTGWKPGRNTETVFTDVYNWILANQNALKPIFS